jgi:uncharacterized protein YceK
VHVQGASLKTDAALCMRLTNSPTTIGKGEVMKLSKVAVAASVLVAVSGCATIIHGTTEKVGFSSTPAGATVSVDGINSGTTPTFAQLKRSTDHTVIIDLPGYEKSSFIIESKLSGWFFGNILIGGVIGIVVDAISGGMYRLTPTELAATLNAKSVSELDGLYVVTVLTPDPSWEKIGNLTPIRAAQ